MTGAQRTREMIGAAIAVQRELGPNLLEAVYQECPCHELTNRNLQFARQKPIPVVYKNAKLDCGYPADIVVADRIIVENQSHRGGRANPRAVMLTYLSGCKNGLLIHFHSAVLKDGIHRNVWKYDAIGQEKNSTQRHRGEKECQKREFAC
jgi:GxxExxY protein